MGSLCNCAWGYHRPQDFPRGRGVDTGAGEGVEVPQVFVQLLHGTSQAVFILVFPFWSEQFFFLFFFPLFFFLIFCAL